MSSNHQRRSALPRAERCLTSDDIVERAARRRSLEDIVRIFLGRRIGPFYIGASFRPQCSHCGKAQPFNWPAFWIGVLLGVAVLGWLGRALL